ncbi:hypothetical protein QE152_g40015 [Popillia japonica]|uniref:Uncharacterized protein n=1 Tax=Popillia japonica TaxID=7064 RepID=A0AAW1HSP6_POPJA
MMKSYTPRMVEGQVNGTGWPIDGSILLLTSWDYDHHKQWHVEAWDAVSDDDVMKTFYQTEKELGMCGVDTLEEFGKLWKNAEWEPCGSFCLPLDKVTVVREVCEEKLEETERNVKC